MESHVGLMGLDLGSELISQTNPYTTSPFGINPWSVDWSITRSSMGGWWNQVSAPLRCLRGWFSPTIPTFVQVTSCIVLTCVTFTICYNCPSCSPNQGLRWFCAAMAMICIISPSYIAYLTYPLIDVIQLHVNRYFNSHSLNLLSYICSHII